MAGPLWGLTCAGIFMTGLYVFGKNYPVLLPMLKQLDTFIGPQFPLYSGGFSIFLLGLAMGLSLTEQKIKRKKMEAQTENEKWVLALSAIYVELSKVLEDDDIASFYRIDMTRAWYFFLIGWITRMGLKNNWGIFDRHSALQILNTLFLKVEDGREKPYLAWDGVRFSHVARLACLNGYLTPEETWEQLKRIGPLMQKNFSSWKDLNENFVTGRIIWRPEGYDLEDIKASYNRLATHSKSPWQTLRWDMKL